MTKNNSIVIYLALIVLSPIIIGLDSPSLDISKLKQVSIPNCSESYTLDEYDEVFACKLTEYSGIFNTVTLRVGSFTNIQNAAIAIRVVYSSEAEYDVSVRIRNGSFEKTYSDFFTDTVTDQTLSLGGVHTYIIDVYGYDLNTPKEFYELQINSEFGNTIAGGILYFGPVANMGGTDTVNNIPVDYQGVAGMSQNKTGKNGNRFCVKSDYLLADPGYLAIRTFIKTSNRTFNYFRTGVGEINYTDDGFGSAHFASNSWVCPSQLETRIPINSRDYDGIFWIVTNDGGSGNVDFRIEPIPLSIPCYSLHVVDMPSGSAYFDIVASDTCPGGHPEGASIDIYPKPNLGYLFSHWSGNESGSSDPLSFAMDQDMNIVGNFSVITYNLLVSKPGTGSGTVTSNPAGIDCGSTCSASYDYNTSVTLGASPAPGSTLAGWSGAGCSGTGNCVVTMTAARSVTATFTENTYTLSVSKPGTGSGTVTSNPAGIDCGSTCSASYDYNTSVTLGASPAPGSTFAGWSGAGCSGTGNCVVTMTAARSVTATFTANTYTLSVSKPGTGSGTVTSNPAGIDCGSTCSASYDYNTSVTLDASPAPGSTFAGWSGAGCSGTGNCVVTMTATRSVTAFFNTSGNYTLSVSKPGTGSGTVTSNPAGIDCGSTCSASYDYNTSVTLGASPAPGSTFAGWSGAGCSGTGNCVVTMTAARSVTATFTANTYTLSVSKPGTGSGTVTSNPAGIDCGSTCSASYDYNTSVTLGASPAPGSTFAGWSGAGCSGTGNCVVTMNITKSVTAGFTLDQQGSDWYVSMTGNDYNNCQSPSTPCLTIQGSIDKAAVGDKVHVASGVYYENVILKDNMHLLGESASATFIDSSGHVVNGGNGGLIAGFTIRNTVGGTSWGYGWPDSSIQDLTIRNNIFIGHYVGIHAGSDPDSINIINNLIANNSSSGVTFGWDMYPTLRNNIIVKNGNGIHWYGTGSPQFDIDYNDVWGNLTNYDVVITPGQYDISTDPTFVDSINGNYHLDGCSPVIDAGDPSDAYNLEPSPNGGRINMGAYGNTDEATSTCSVSFRDTIGLHNPLTSIFYLRNAHAGGDADEYFRFGPTDSGWLPIAGDWDNDGIDTVGMFDPVSGKFYLRNAHAAGNADVYFRFGPTASGWIPIAGDWDNDGIDTVGLFDPTSSKFYLRNAHAGGDADVYFRFGPTASGWIPIAGDWDNDGIDTVGLFDPASGKFFLRNAHAGGDADVYFRFGPLASGWIPIAGDWDGS